MFGKCIFYMTQAKTFYKCKIDRLARYFDSHFLADKDTEVLKGQMCSIK